MRGEPIFTRGFRRLLDIILSLLGIGVALGSSVEGDLAYSVALAAVGAAAGTPLPLTVAGSVPVALLAEAGLPPGEAHLLVALLRAARAGGVMLLVSREASGLGLVLDRALLQAGLLAFVTLLGGAWALYLSEAPAGGVESFWDALWLALVTMTTVGYGDVVPATPHGRLVAVLIMLVGIGIFTFFLSSMAVGLSTLVLSGEASLPPTERKKRAIIDMIRHLEDLSSQEFEAMVNDLRMLYLLATADRRELLRLDLSPQALGLPESGAESTA